MSASMAPASTGRRVEGGQARWRGQLCIRVRRQVRGAVAIRQARGQGARKLDASGDGYEGEWKADRKQGFGTFWSASGEVYEGQWLTGTYEGRGTHLYASSDVYEGEYHNGKRDGRGVYMYASGDVYEGEYKQGKMEGRGIYRLADGTPRPAATSRARPCWHRWRAPIGSAPTGYEGEGGGGNYARGGGAHRGQPVVSPYQPPRSVSGMMQVRPTPTLHRASAAVKRGVAMRTRRMVQLTLRHRRATQPMRPAAAAETAAVETAAVETAAVETAAVETAAQRSAGASSGQTRGRSCVSNRFHGQLWARHPPASCQRASRCVRNPRSTSRHQLVPASSVAR